MFRATARPPSSLLECSAVAEAIGDRTAQAFAVQLRGAAEMFGNGSLDVALEYVTAGMALHAVGASSVGPGLFASLG